MGYIINTYDLNIYDFWFAGPPNKMRAVTDWALGQNAELCWNLGLFEWSGQSDTYVHSRGKDICYGGENFSDVLWVNAANACRGYSNGIKNGVLDIRKTLGGSALRNGIGRTTSGEIIIAQSDTAVTEKIFCTNVNKILQGRGKKVELFLLQDGGGSVSEYSNIARLGWYPKERRKVVTVTCAVRKKKQKILRVLRKGCKGPDVVLLQQLLSGLDGDGDFGRKTEARVREMQRALGLVPDGSVGPLTKAKLGL